MIERLDSWTSKDFIQIQEFNRIYRLLISGHFLKAWDMMHKT